MTAMYSAMTIRTPTKGRYTPEKSPQQNFAAVNSSQKEFKTIEKSNKDDDEKK